MSVTTFNHERYIARALDGILRQKTDFDYEIVVGEDVSNDQTRAIVRDYETKYGDRIRTVFPPRNLGGLGKRIFAETLKVCRGEYIACMDGDDYWTSERKLQKQVEFLERHSHCSMCFHDVLIMFENDSRAPRRFVSWNQPVFTDVASVLASCFIPACSPVFRRNALLPLPDWYFDVPGGDWSLYLIAAQEGNIGYLDEVMGVYRVHRDGMWSGRTRLQQLQGLVEFYDGINRATKYRYADVIAGRLSHYYCKLAEAHLISGDHRAAKDAAWTGLRSDGFSWRDEKVLRTKTLLRFVYASIMALGRRALV